MSSKNNLYHGKKKNGHKFQCEKKLSELENCRRGEENIVDYIQKALIPKLNTCFDYKITFQNSKHAFRRLICSENQVLKARWFQRFLIYKDKSNSDFVQQIQLVTIKSFTLHPYTTRIFSLKYLLIILCETNQMLIYVIYFRIVAEVL